MAKAPSKPRAKKSETSVANVGKSRKPTQDQVARRAYEIWLARGGVHGNDQDDWLQAERELDGHSD